MNSNAMARASVSDKIGFLDKGTGITRELHFAGKLQLDMPAKIEFLESALASQEMTLCLQTALAAVLFVVGLTVVVLSFVHPGLILAETLKTGQALGGTLVAVSGFIPIFFSRRDKVVALRALLHSYQHQQVGGLSRDAKLDQHFDQYCAKVIGG